MTDLHLPRLDLARAVTDALGRGRYVLMTSGDGTPQEITLDLKERDDDLFGTELADTEHDGMVPDRIRTEGGVWVHVQRPADAPPCSDDHGATIPAQGEHHRSAEIVGEENGWAVREPGPRVYEFALQEAKRPPWADAATFDNATMLDAPDALSANAADWVHVYDRVTRERRTLKRPEPDRILTGLRDVAADLRRGYPLDQAAARWAINEAYPERGAPVEPPFGCAALPPVGPLTSTEGLRAGDVLRVIKPLDGKNPHPHGTPHTLNAVVVYVGTHDDGLTPRENEIELEGGFGRTFSVSRFAFVGRPDASGWMTWAGGENPVPGAVVEVGLRCDDRSRWGNDRNRADDLRWSHIDGERAVDVVAFRIVDTPPAA